MFLRDTVLFLILLKPVLGAWTVACTLHYLPWTGSIKPSLQHLQFCCFGLSLGFLFSCILTNVLELTLPYILILVDRSPRYDILSTKSDVKLQNIISQRYDAELFFCAAPFISILSYVVAFLDLDNFDEIFL